MLRLSNLTLSGGTQFFMNATNASIDWNNHLEVEQHPSKAISSGLDVRLPQGNYLGHEAPKVTFQGFVDTSKSDPSYVSGLWGNTPQITLSGLGQLARIGSGYLYFPPLLQFIGSPVDRQNLNTGSIGAMIQSVRLLPDSNQYFHAFSGMIPYNMELVIVSGPI